MIDVKWFVYSLILIRVCCINLSYMYMYIVCAINVLFIFISKGNIKVLKKFLQTIVGDLHGRGTLPPLPAPSPPTHIFNI